MRLLWIVLWRLFWKDGRAVCVALSPPLLCGLLMCGLPGCSLTQPAPSVQYYVLALPQLPEPSSPASPTLVVHAFRAHDPYDQQRLVYRSSPYQLDFYTYHRWASAPAAQVTDWTRRYLRSSGLFAKVFPTPEGDADYVLGGTLRHIEELDRDETWEAALEIEVWLTRPPQRTPVWFESYAVTHQAAKRNPAAVAEAMSHNLGVILHRLAADLRPLVGAE